MKNLIPCIILSMIFTFSCLNCKQEDCANTNPYLTIRGYDSSELTNVTVIKFSKGSDFQIMISSVELSSTYHSIQKGDSLSFYVNQGIDFSYDYIIKISDTGRQYRLKDMVMSETHAKYSFGESRDVCYDEITSYNLDDQPYSTGLSGSTNYNGDYGNRAKIELKK